MFDAFDIGSWSLLRKVICVVLMVTMALGYVISLIHPEPGKEVSIWMFCAIEGFMFLASASVGRDQGGISTSRDSLGWLNRAVDAFERGECEKIVMLIPTRTDSSTFHDRVVPIADVGLIRGRMRFDSPDGPAYPAPFALMIVVFGGSGAEIEHFGRLVPAAWLRRAAQPVE